jgi:hypothetical protein
MRNQYPGICYFCSKKVEPGDGHFERERGVGWRVIHANCVFELRSIKQKQTEEQESRRTGIKMSKTTSFRMVVSCPYCGKQAEWCENKEVYGKNFGRSYMIYLCRKCDAYVGCHNNTIEPLGTMADKELRDWRQKAHALFDPLWQPDREKRKELYKEIAKSFGQVVHIAEADIEMCKNIIDWVNAQERKI